MPRRSFKIWAVLECGWEHSTLRGTWTLKRDAQAHRDKLDRDWVAASRFNSKPNFKIQQTDLVVHDGAHSLLVALVDAVKVNRGTP